ncbi:ABC transporter permease [Candidatus Margulisiibacteriota bacterium]
MVNLKAIYILWLRDIKIFFRLKSKLISSLVMPVILLIVFSSGFRNMDIFHSYNKNIEYIQFLVPALICMNLIFAATAAGISVISDKNYGFLKEIMVAPVSRIAIVIGKILGAASVALLKAIMLLIISFFIGFKIYSFLYLIPALIVMFLISSIFIGLGLILSSVIKDIYSFGLIINFIVYPLFFLSGAFFPLNNLSPALKFLAYLDPLTYGLDALRGTLIGVSAFPFYLNIIIVFVFSVLFTVLGAFFLSRTNPT